MPYDHGIIIGASGGIGAALLRAAPARRITGLSRREDGLDIRDEAALAAAAARAGAADLIIGATGALEIEGQGPEKSFAGLDPATLARHFATNAIGPALILKHFMPNLPRDRRAVIALLSARVGSIGDNRLGGWVSYRAAKAALNQIVHTAAIELARTHKQAICVAVHPGTVATDLTRRYAGSHPMVAPDDAARNLISVLSGLTPAETGGFFDWQGDRVPW